MRIFIGGSKAISSLTAEFTVELDRIIADGHEILIGDCYGTDLLVQMYLVSRNYGKVTVYVSGDKVRHNAGGFAVRHIAVPNSCTGFDFRRQKDIAMAEDADCGLMLWDGKSRGTAANIADLRTMDKEVKVYVCAETWRVLGD